MDGCKRNTTLCPVIIHKNCGALQLARETYWNELLTTVLNRAKGMLIFTRKYTRRAEPPSAAELEPAPLKSHQGIKQGRALWCIDCRMKVLELRKQFEDRHHWELRIEKCRYLALNADVERHNACNNASIVCDAVVIKSNSN